MNIQDKKLYMKHHIAKKPENTNERKIYVQDAFFTMNISHNAFLRFRAQYSFY